VGSESWEYYARLDFGGHIRQNAWLPNTDTNHASAVVGTPMTQKKNRPHPGNRPGTASAHSPEPKHELASGEPADPVESFWKRMRLTRKGRLFAGVFALIIIAATIGEAVKKVMEIFYSARKSLESVSKWPVEPAVLYIYANGEFGLLRKVGFERGSDVLETRQIYHVQYLAASLDRLKRADISEIRDELSSRLKARTVAAVVAPSITEATRPVIELVRQINRTVPIILESSIDPADLNWEQDGHLFRLSSGVDTRGIEIGHVIVSLLKSGRPVAILAEDGPTTYGGKMLHYAASISPLIDSVPVLRYSAGGLDRQIASTSPANEVIRRLGDTNAVIFFLGLGRDMESLLNIAYSNTGPLRGQAKIVGVMNAYKLGPLFETQSSFIRSHLVYEITDFDFIFSFDPPKAAVAFGEMLASSKPLTPALRDQAYSYDEAVLLGEAIRSASKAHSYGKGLERVNAYLLGYSGRGVTGNIVLAGRKPDASGASRIPAGQNVGSTVLRLAHYEPDTHTWVITSASSL
jgi:hypothetical protein